MSIATKLTQIAENEQKVYDAGAASQKAESDLQLWKMLTNNGTKGTAGKYDREKMFYLTDFTGYTFAKPLINSGAPGYCTGMFYGYMGTALPDNIGFENVDASTNIDSLFTWGTSLTEIPDLGLPAMDSYYHFAMCVYKAKKIAVIRCHKDSTFVGAFTSSSAAMGLEDITFEGEIGQDLDMSDCAKLTYESLKNISSCLYDYSGTEETHTLGLGSTNQAKLTEAELAEITQKGWSIT